MQLNTVIFDIDGLLLDSEPLWSEAAAEVFTAYNILLSEKQYLSSTGLRTKEFVDLWFEHFKIDKSFCRKAEMEIVDLVLSKIKTRGKILSGVPYIFDFFYSRNFKIGLATSSPQSLIDLVINIAKLGKYIQATASAEDLIYGKPNPQVYLNCAEKLNSSPLQCLCFEDSFNGMLAAKSARMKCVVVPNPIQSKEKRWAAADLSLSSLLNFGELHLNILNG